MHVPAGGERRGGHGRVSGRRGQVDDDVDAVVGEQQFERVVGSPAVRRDELGSPTGQHVGRAGEREARRVGDALRVARCDVPGSDEGDVHASHPSSCSRIVRTSSLGSNVSGSCSTAIAPS